MTMSNALASELHSLYWNDLYSLSDIAQLHGVSIRTILNRMVKHGIPRRSSAVALRVERCRAKRRAIRLQFHKNNPNFQRGRSHPRWGGGIAIDKETGYIRVHVPHHPNATKRGYVLQHRIVMEQELRRYLLPTEIVYHEDGDGGNNDPDNLKLFKNQSSLMVYLGTLK